MLQIQTLYKKQISILSTFGKVNWPLTLPSSNPKVVGSITHCSNQIYKQTNVLIDTRSFFKKKSWTYHPNQNQRPALAWARVW